MSLKDKHKEITMTNEEFLAFCKATDDPAKRKALQVIRAKEFDDAGITNGFAEHLSGCPKPEPEPIDDPERNQEALELLFTNSIHGAF